MIEMASIMIGVAGVAQQLKTANASPAAPSGLRILDFNPSSGSGNTDAVDIQENEESISAQFNHDGSSFSSGTYSADINIGTLSSNYTGSAAAVTLEFGGFLDGTIPSGTTFLWDVTTGSNTSLSAGTTSIIGTASTSQDSLGFSGADDGVGEKARLTFGGGKGGFVFPSVNDVWHIEVSCTATSAGGSASAQVDIEYTFVL